jgi:RNA polymerase sigma factor (sigma-70 family)
MQTDRILAARLVRHRDEAAFRALYRTHTPRLYALLLRLLGGRTADAEDAVQETWIRVVAGVGRFRWEAALSTWILRIGVNVAHEVLRKTGPIVATAPDPPASNDPDGALALDLERALTRLPPRERTVVVLHDVEGWTHEEIGRELGIAPGTSKSHLFAARRALRARLAPPGGGR